jgi:hypothetical protein
MNAKNNHRRRGTEERRWKNAEKGHRREGNFTWMGRMNRMGLGKRGKTGCGGGWQGSLRYAEAAADFDANRDSETDRANGGGLRELVR